MIANIKFIKLPQLFKNTKKNHSTPFPIMKEPTNILKLKPRPIIKIKMSDIVK
jgi:hypothetical protein